MTKLDARDLALLIELAYDELEERRNGEDEKWIAQTHDLLAKLLTMSAECSGKNVAVIPQEFSELER